MERTEEKGVDGVDVQTDLPLMSQTKNKHQFSPIFDTKDREGEVLFKNLLQGSF